jgi:hypothetical protein
MLADLRNDTLRLASEIDKLILHSRGKEAVTREDVLALLGAGEETSAWALSEALADGNAALAVQALRRLLAEGEAAPMIVGTLASRLRQLVVLRDERASGRTNEAARRVVFPGRSGYFADVLARKAARPRASSTALATLRRRPRREVGAADSGGSKVAAFDFEIWRSCAILIVASPILIVADFARMQRGRTCPLEKELPCLDPEQMRTSK